MVEVQGLIKEYDGHPALSGVSFTLEPGRIYGFLGPNGAGKSTTMNIISGCLAATEGEVRICGYDIFTQHKEAKKHIGYLPELPPLYQDMSVAEYLGFVCELKKVPSKERAAEAERVMSLTGILDKMNRLIRQLSKGYRQRVGIAQAMIGSPDFIILDEPMVGLDPQQIIEIRSLIRSLGKAHTVLLSSHILSEISEICDEVMIISQGRLIARDTPDALSSRMGASHRLRFTAGGDADAVRTALESVPGLVIASVKQNGAYAEAEADIDGEDVRDAAADALMRAGIPVREMTAEKLSLEDVFLQLTREGGQNGGDI